MTTAVPLLPLWYIARKPLRAGTTYLDIKLRLKTHTQTHTHTHTHTHTSRPHNSFTHTRCFLKQTFNWGWFITHTHTHTHTRIGSLQESELGGRHIAEKMLRIWGLCLFSHVMKKSTIVHTYTSIHTCTSHHNIRSVFLSPRPRAPCPAGFRCLTLAPTLDPNEWVDKASGWMNLMSWSYESSVLEPLTQIVGWYLVSERPWNVARWSYWLLSSWR